MTTVICFLLFAHLSQSEKSSEGIRHKDYDSHCKKVWHMEW